MKELLNTYYPIEIDPHRTAEEKLPLMVEWWETITWSEFEDLSLIRQCWNSCKASFSLLLLLPSVGGHKSTSCWLNRESGKTCWPRLSGNPGRCWGICWKYRPGRPDAFSGRDRSALLIFSAGIGDVLEEVIQQNRVFHPNIRIISNYMEFDQAVSCTTLGSTLPTKMLRIDVEIESRPVNTLFHSS